MTLNWSGVAGASAYTVYWSNQPGVTNRTGTPINTELPELTHTALSNGVRYYYVISSSGERGESGVSQEVSAMPVVAVPASPQDVVAQAGNGRVTLRWQAVGGATGYRVYWSVDAQVSERDTLIDNVVSPLVHNDLQNNQSYYYIVVAQNYQGLGAASSIVEARPIEPIPPAPIMNQPAVSAESVELFFSDVSRQPGVKTEYDLYWNTRGNVTETDASIRGITSPYRHTPLRTGQDYYYRVQARNSGGASALSNSVRIQPPGIGEVSTVGNVANIPGLDPIPPQDGQLTLSWDAVPGALAYNLYWSDQASGQISLPNNKISNIQSPYTHIQLNNGTTYRYLLSAINDNGESGLSAEVSGTPLSIKPGVPAGVQADGGDERLAIRWLAVEQALSYTVYITDTTSGEEQQIDPAKSPLLANASNLSNGLVNGRSYRVEVTATNPRSVSARSQVAEATPQEPPPVAPSRLTAEPGNAQVILRWSPALAQDPTDPEETVQAYRVYYSSQSGVTADNGIAIPALDGAGQPNYQTISDRQGQPQWQVRHSGVGNGQSYYYIVTAINVGGESRASNEVWARPQVPIAAMPNNIWAAAGDNLVVLNFDQATEGAVASYNLYWNRAETNQSGVNVRSATQVITNILPGYLFEDGNNSNGKTYYFRLATVNAGGESPLSAEVSASPQIPPPQNAPQNVSSVAMQSQVSVLWTPSSDPSVQAYVLYWSTEANIDAAVSAKISGADVQPGYLHTGRTNGEVIYYRVAAVNAGGESALSKLIVALPQWDAPGKPSNVTVTAGDNEVFVNWPLVSTATSYNLYWHSDPINGDPLTNWSNRRGVVPGTRLTGLNNAQLYHFQLLAQNAGGASVPSDIVSIAPQQAAPATPEGLTIAAGDGQLSLNWGTRANESYTLYWTTDTNPANLPIDSGNQINNIRPTYIHREESAGVPLSNGTVYRYQLIASNSGGPSLATSEVRASPAAVNPTAPQALRAEARDGEVLLSWLPPATGSGPYTYTVYWSNTAGSTSGTAIDNLSSAGYRHRGLSNKQTYYYVVTATDTASGLESEASLPTNASPQGQTPRQVVGVWVAAGDRQNVIGWRAEAGSSQYLVEWSSQVDAGNALQGTIGSTRVQAPETQYTHRPLNNGETFYYRVSGENNNGPNASLQSGLVSATVSGTPQNQSNNLPQIQQGALVNVDMDEDSNPRPFSLSLNASDNDVTDSLTWRIAGTAGASNGTASVIGNNTSATVTYNPNPNYDQADQFIVEVDDGRGGVDSISVVVNIAAQNDAPVFNALADQSHLDGASVTLDASASDIDNTILTYSATGLPPGLSIDTITGQINGVIGATASGGSPYTVTLTVDDKDPVASAQDTVTINWDVGAARADPNVSTASLNPVEASIVAGTTVTIIVTTRDSSGSIIATGGESVALTITGANAAGPLAATDNNDGTYTVTYNAQLAGLDTYLLTIDQAGNPTPISGPYSKTIIPAAANAANSISLIPAGPYTTGVAVNLDVQVRDVYGNASIATVEYAITGNNPQNLTGIDQGSGLYRVTYTPAQIGTDMIAVTVNTTALSNSPFSRTINASSSSAANSNVTIPAGPYIAGQPVTLAAQINDVNNQPTTGFVSFEIQGANPQTVTGVLQGGGVYQVDYNPTKVGLGTDVIISRVDTVVIGTDQMRNINPGAADITKSLLTINIPNAATEATAGDQVSLDLQVFDAYNNPTAAVVGMRLSGANVQVLTPGNPVLGTYTASYLATAQGADTYIVTVDTASMPSQFLIVNSGKADLANSTLTVTPVGSATTGDTVVIELKLQDGFNNPTTATVVMSVSNANPQNLIPGNPATGTYRASYIPTVAGVDDYSITVNNTAMLLPPKTILLNNIAPTDISITTNSVAENSANATRVGSLAAVDTAGDTHSYSFVAPNNDAGGRFVIVGNQVQVANGALLDFETNTSHLITVQAQDQGALVFSRDITINIGDVNDVIPVITNTALTPSIPENSTAVTALTVSDVDTVNAPFVYTLTGADAAQFEVVNNNLQFTAIAIPDFELPADVGADNIYNVSVAVYDGVNTSNLKDFIVTITNVVEQTLSATNLNAPESFVENDPVFSLLPIVVTAPNPGPVTVTFLPSDVNAGTLFISTTATVTTTNDAVSGRWTATGPMVDLNGVLNNVTFTPAAGFTQNFNIATSVSDAITSLTGVKTVTVTAANVAPIINAQTPTPISILADSTLVIDFSHLTVIDPDNTYPTGFSLTVMPGTNYSVVGTSITPVTAYVGPLAVGVRVNDGLSDSNTFSLQIDVVPPIFYVSSAALNDSGDGLSVATAKMTITAAIAAATAPATIQVSSGTYNVNSDTRNAVQTHIIMKDGVSLYGGYTRDFAKRLPNSQISIIQDFNAEARGTAALTARVVQIDAGVSAATIIDGFTIRASVSQTVDYNSAVLVQNGGAATIQNNIIDGGNATIHSFGIQSISSSPTIQYNKIYGGAGKQISYGLSNNASSPLIKSNSINGGTGGSIGVAADGSTAIRNENASNPIIQYNTIVAGCGSTCSFSAGVDNYLSDPTIEFNYIYGGRGSARSRAIRNLNSYPLIQNNSLYGGNGGSNSYGIESSGGSVLSGKTMAIHNNVILGGSGAISDGIYNVKSASPLIRNNTIDGGSGSSASYGIRYVLGAVIPVIENNIIYTSGPATAYCVYDEDPSATPRRMQHNDLYACKTAIYYHGGSGCIGNADADANPRTCTLTEIEGLYNFPNGSANFSVDALLMDKDGLDNDITTLEDNDMRFSGVSPTMVTIGGLNGSYEATPWGFMNDRDGALRTDLNLSWSHGAYSVGAIRYVSAAANDDNGDGLSPASAKKTITAAIANVKGPATIRVNRGIFQVNSDTLSHVILKEGVSILGGHAPDFSARDRGLYRSLLSDSGGITSLGAPSKAIEAPPGITTATVVEGFTISGSSAAGVNYSAGIYTKNASPTLRNNKIQGGGGITSYAVYNAGVSQGVIQNNIIEGGEPASSSFGIINMGSSPIIQSNRINADVGIESRADSEAIIVNNLINASSRAIVNDLGHPVIRNNTIIVSGRFNLIGVYNVNNSMPVIENNILSMLTPDASTCVSAPSVKNPASMQNNDLFGCTTVYFTRDQVCGAFPNLTNRCTLSEMESLIVFGSSNATGNISADPLLLDINGPDNSINFMDDNDWHLTPASPVAVREGGLNFSANFYKDNDNKTRTAIKLGLPGNANASGWSMGAYEQD